MMKKTLDHVKKSQWRQGDQQKSDQRLKNEEEWAREEVELEEAAGEKAREDMGIVEAPGG